jgi:hypothetical protein
MVDHAKLTNLDYGSAEHIGFTSQEDLTVVSGALNSLILESNYFGSIITISGTYKGDTLTVVVDDASAVFGNVLYQANDFHYERADADIAVTMPCRAIVIEPGVGSQKVLVRGQICDNSWDWLPGTIWVSLVTGELTQTKPSGNEDQVQEVGWALSADTIFFDSTSIVLSASAGDRGVFAGGYVDNYFNVIEYITISIIGNATNFGDLTLNRAYMGSCSNGISGRGIFGGGYDGGRYNIIEYIAILNIGNSVDFGDLTIPTLSLGTTSNGINERGVFGGGNLFDSNTNTIEYITINSVGNAANFGDLTVTRRDLAGSSNGANDRGIFVGGSDALYYDTVDYITISTTNNATDFGDLTVARYGVGACSNGINERGVAAGGYNGSYLNIIDYVTINSLSNASDFGDLNNNLSNTAGTSNTVNERGVFGGGAPLSNTIDYVTMNSNSNAVDFGDLTTTKMATSATSNA